MPTKRKAWQKRAAKDESVHGSWPSGDPRLARLEIKRRAVKAGNLGAILDALTLCYRFGLPLPQWLWEATDKALLSGFEGKQDLPRWLKKYKSDMIDFWRYDEVCEVRGLYDHERPLEKWTDVFKKVSLRLTRTPAFGSADAIKASYKRCKRRSKTEPYRYHRLRAFPF